MSLGCTTRICAVQPASIRNVALLPTSRAQTPPDGAAFRRMTTSCASIMEPIFEPSKLPLLPTTAQTLPDGMCGCSSIASRAADLRLATVLKQEVWLWFSNMPNGAPRAHSLTSSSSTNSDGGSARGVACTRAGSCIYMCAAPEPSNHAQHQTRARHAAAATL